LLSAASFAAGVFMLGILSYEDYAKNWMRFLPIAVVLLIYFLVGAYGILSDAMKKDDSAA